LTRPSCAHRLAVRIRPRAGVAHHLTIRLRDRWSLGGLRARICVRRPGRERHAGRGACTRHPRQIIDLATPRPGGWEMTVRDAYGGSSRRLVWAEHASGRLRLLVRAARARTGPVQRPVPRGQRRRPPGRPRVPRTRVADRRQRVLHARQPLPGLHDRPGHGLVIHEPDGVHLPPPPTRSPPSSSSTRCAPTTSSAEGSSGLRVVIATLSPVDLSVSPGDARGCTGDGVTQMAGAVAGTVLLAAPAVAVPAESQSALQPAGHAAARRCSPASVVVERMRFGSEGSFHDFFDMRSSTRDLRHSGEATPVPRRRSR
jgi:hypothetical protein